MGAGLGPSLRFKAALAGSPGTVEPGGETPEPAPLCALEPTACVGPTPPPAGPCSVPDSTKLACPLARDGRA